MDVTSLVVGLLISFLLVGIIAGWLAGLLMYGGGFGLLGNIGVGIVAVERLRPNSTIVRMAVLREPAAGVAGAAGITALDGPFTQQCGGKALDKSDLANALAAVEQDRVR